MKRTILFFIVLCTFFAIVIAVFADTSSLPEIHITLSEGMTLEQINSGNKSIKYGGNSVLLIDSEGNSETHDDVELKGRGNFTWLCLDKKSYQLKFSEKVSVFGMDPGKKWICTSNHGDITLMRNRLAYDLAKKIHLPAPDSVFIDLYVNDEYIGNYLLSEKNEVGVGRVELFDDYGVLCEVDGNYGKSEDYTFKTAINQNLIVLSDSKTDDLNNEQSVALEAFRHFEKKLNSFEALLYSPDATWDDIETLIDVESFIQYYFLQELCEDSDGCRSSMYLYSDGKDDVIHLGPVWDFDIAFGQFIGEERGGNPEIDYTNNIHEYYSKSVDWFRLLFQHEEFSELAVNMYSSIIKPVFESIPQIIDDYQTIPGFSKSVKKNFRRWPDLLGQESVYGNTAHRYKNSYRGERDYMLDWISTRIQYLNKRYAKGGNSSVKDLQST